MDRINFDFMQNCCGYSDDVTSARLLPNNFTNQRFVVTIPICNVCVSFMIFASIFEATRFTVIGSQNSTTPVLKQ